MMNMKPSGVEWIGDIPAEWETRRLKYILHERKEKNDPIKTDNILSLSAAQGVVPYSERQGGGNKAKEDLTAYKVVHKGDIVLNSMNVLSGAVNYSNYTGCASPVYYMLYSDNDIVTRYYNLLFQTEAFQKSLRGLGNGILIKETDEGKLNTIRMRIPMEKLGNVILPIPTYADLEAIVNSIEPLCSKLDEIITEAEKSIEEYKELKQAVIFEAVTKGLDKNAPMKDSGVEWIGEMPSSWALVRIPRILDYRDVYPLGDGDHGMIKTEDYQNEGIPYIRVQNLGWGTDLLLDNVVYISAENNEKIKSSQLKPNDVLFCKTGGTIGKTGMVPENLPVSNTTSHVGKITVNPAYNARYVFYVLSSNVGYRQFWEIACQKTTRPELSIAETRQIRLTWPSSRKEQDDIVSYLDSIVPEYDYLISEKQSLIEDLKAYKKSLIYEVVTGKRRVV